MKEELIGTLKNLTPQELSVVKSQVAILLNYTTRGGSVATLPKEVLTKIPQEDRKRIKEAIGKLFQV